MDCLCHSQGIDDVNNEGAGIKDILMEVGVSSDVARAISENYELKIQTVDVLLLLP